MGTRKADSKLNRVTLLILVTCSICCCIAYIWFSQILRPNESQIHPSTSLYAGIGENSGLEQQDEEVCCRGVEHLELWGDALNWGEHFKVNYSKDCCKACKAMCKDENGNCACNSWVFCGNKEACGARYGECWLKHQKNVLSPDVSDSGEHVIWTSGLVFGRKEGIFGLKTEYGTLRIKLLPDCAPQSVFNIIDLLSTRHCEGCRFYRAESRGKDWNSDGNHIENAPFGPPYALLQGTLESFGHTWKENPIEFCPTIRRGSVAWIGTSPEFFISLANHNEWKKPYNVFGYVIFEDMKIAETIVGLPTRQDFWGNVDVSVLEKPVLFHFSRT